MSECHCFIRIWRTVELTGCLGHERDVDPFVNNENNFQSFILSIGLNVYGRLPGERQRTLHLVTWNTLKLILPLLIYLNDLLKGILMIYLLSIYDFHKSQKLLCFFPMDWLLNWYSFQNNLYRNFRVNLQLR